MKAVLLFSILLIWLAPIFSAQALDISSFDDELPLPPPPAPPPDGPAQPPSPPPTPPQQPAPPPTNPGRISVGEFVISGPFSGGQYRTGVVVKVSKDGRTIGVRDDDDDRIYSRDASLISRQLNCGPHGICPGDRVLVGPFNGQQYYKGVVRAAYERGLFVIQDDDDGRSYVRSDSKVAKSLPSDPVLNVSPGEHVLSGPFDTLERYYVSTVMGVYTNGILLVRDNFDGQTYARPRNLLSPEVNCYKKLCQGDEVKTGRVQNAFSNGKFNVYEYGDRNYHIRDFKDLKKK